ncbi:hypothetical protein F2Q69_00030659 [Brassica cretica]|uniref:Uncharacterized protein n=1 Tax=Brassica cretica TaxID=69181 RepID=A0A8S9S3E3_BRACR|nr:hypothetical protein F2Q69_00030659 [Brassica cretica]
MTSRRSNSRYSDKVQTRTGSANAERIRSGDVSDVSDALTEVLREETRLPRLQPKGPKIPRVKNLLLVLSRVARRVRRGVIVLQRRLKRMVRTIVLVSRVKRLLLSRFIGSSRIARIVLLRKIQKVLLI